MADFGIYGELPQFGDPVAFAINGTLPQFGGSIVVNDLSFEIAGELHQFEGAIESTQGRTFAVAGILPQFSGELKMVQGRVFSLAGVLKQFDGSILMSHNRQFSIAGTLKQFTGSIVTHATSDFSIAGTLKQFTGDIQFAGTFRVVVVNPALRGVTEYTNYDFNSIIELGGQYYGFGAAGVYLLAGLTDNGTAISSYFDSGDTEYAKGQKSKILDAHLLGRTSGTLSLTLTADDGTSYPYGSIGDATGTLQNHRFKPGKGVEGIRHRYRVANVTGSTLEAQEIRLLVGESQRKR